MSIDEELVEVAHFGADWESAGAARRFVSATLTAWRCDALEYVVTLLVSELVANAVLHAGTELDVVLRRPEGGVRVEVHDRDHRLPTRKHYSITATTGRGLALVEELARDWGAEATPEGKFVWFEFDESEVSVGQSLMGVLGLEKWEHLSDAAMEPAPSGNASADDEKDGLDPSRTGGVLAIVGRS
ncbi:hypothetical protein BH24ACT1_BH24ACT1_03640 [soil metagenome]